MGAVLGGFSSLPVCLRLWPWHLKLLADFTLIWQNHSNCKIWGSFKLPKGGYSAIRDENRYHSWEEKAGWASWLVWHQTSVRRGDRKSSAGKNHKAGAEVWAGTRKSCPQLSLHSMWVLCWVMMYWWRRRWCINAELLSGFALLCILWGLGSIFTATVLFTWRNQTALVLMCLGCPVYLLHYECLFWNGFSSSGL